jgi:hypothetical protein
MVVIGKTVAEASTKAKKTTFYKHTSIDGAPSHIDDKYGIDVDDVFEINEILPEVMKNSFSIKLIKTDTIINEKMNLGYFKLNEL